MRDCSDTERGGFSRGSKGKDTETRNDVSRKLDMQFAVRMMRTRCVLKDKEMAAGSYLSWMKMPTASTRSTTPATAIKITPRSESPAYSSVSDDDAGGAAVVEPPGANVAPSAKLGLAAASRALVSGDCSRAKMKVHY